MISSVYIHIPFCKKICSYCDFCKVFYNKKMVKEYLESLENEINTKYKGEIINTVYIGGGTPSSLSIKELKELFRIIKVFKLDKTYEFTIECNFDSITKEKLDLFKENGINRISFGLETINKDVLNELNRDLDIDYIREIIDYSNDIGLNNINLDLMYGFSFSNFDNLKKDIEFILSLDIKHISTYSLILEKNTLLDIKKYKNIDEDLDREMYEYIHATLKDNGFNHYEISNFAKVGYESRHNLVYWHNEEYYGFGVGASSYFDDLRISSSRSITNYNKKIYNYEYEELTNNDKYIYEIILGLRLKEGIDIDNFKKKFGFSIKKNYNIDKMIKDGKIVINNNHLKVPFNNWYVINRILLDFMEVNYE